MQQGSRRRFIWRGERRGRKGWGEETSLWGQKWQKRKRWRGKEMGKEKEREGGEVGKGNVVNVHRSGYN